MPERLTQTTPPIPPRQVDYRIVSLVLDWEESRVAVKLRGDTGDRVGHQYTGAPARTLLRALNTADLSASSLQRRILQRLLADGVIQGAITGAPE